MLFYKKIIIKIKKLESEHFIEMDTFQLNRICRLNILGNLGLCSPYDTYVTKLKFLIRAYHRSSPPLSQMAQTESNKSSSSSSKSSSDSSVTKNLDLLALGMISTSRQNSNNSISMQHLNLITKMKCWDKDEKIKITRRECKLKNILSEPNLISWFPFLIFHLQEFFQNL